MSLDVSLIANQPVSVFDANITHNLTEMASEVKLSNGMTLYQVLWRPDESNLKYARDIADLLEEGWNILMADPEHFKKFNPENGWGSYGGLKKFVYKYLEACRFNPDAELEISR
jgi:hypothetical protein